MSTPVPSRRTRLLGAGLLAATFGAGTLAGAAFTRVLDARETRAEAPAPPRASPGTGHRAALLDSLALTPGQRVRVDAIMARRKEQSKAFWEAEGRRLRTIVDSARAEIRTVLTPEQRARYDRLREELKARRHAEEQARAAAKRGGSGDAGVKE